jgi:hypothetical protein
MDMAAQKFKSALLFGGSTRFFTQTCFAHQLVAVKPRALCLRMSIDKLSA